MLTSGLFFGIHLIAQWDTILYSELENYTNEKISAIFHWGQ